MNPYTATGEDSVQHEWVKKVGLSVEFGSGRRHRSNGIRLTRLSWSGLEMVPTLINFVLRVFVGL